MIKYQGQFSDGRSARSVDVVVHLQEHGIDIFEEASGDLLGGWAYGELESSVYVEISQPVHLGNKTYPGARLYIANNAGERADFAEILLGHVPHLSRQRANQRVVFGLAGVAAVFVALFVVISWLDLSPSRGIAKMIPEKVRQGLGDQVVGGLSGGHAACSHPEGSKAFAKLLKRLSIGAGQAVKFEVQIIPIGMVNAFAAPGERIVVSKKLVDFVQSPEELAGVIAHEMGHGVKLHPEVGIVRALGISAAISIAFGGSAGGFGDIGAMLLQLKYSRSAEFEADAIALSILEKAEVPAKPFASFFARMDKKRSLKINKKAPNSTDVNSKDTKSSDESGLMKTLALLSTHPSSPERIAIIEKQPKWSTRPLLSTKEWNALQNICGKN